uniref:Predicted protein putative n=1 Tax=Albugo laibachii Nc14 TaxID=890382 RepID=F0WA27_9STRA|nr:predicted protein putative [Albugo laibachii Nc14]|eukprot:CCA17997.1 predicted protein putative [Albugo laibachii Nc14]
MAYATPTSEFPHITGHHHMPGPLNLHESCMHESHRAHHTCGSYLNERDGGLGLNIDEFATPSVPVSSKGQNGMNGGRWTEQEHESFLVGLRLYGREWKKVASKIRTRTSAQIRSHAQKYFAKISRDDQQRRKESGESLLRSPTKAHDETTSQSSDITTSIPNGYSTDSGSSTSTSNLSEHGDADISYRGTERARKQNFDSTYRFGISSEPDEDGNALVAPVTSEIFRFPVNLKSKKACTTERPDPAKRRKYYRNTVHNLKKKKSLPSQEELIESVSPNVRHRLSSLIEAELCALQVLSYYTLFQID